MSGVYYSHLEDEDGTFKTGVDYTVGVQFSGSPTSIIPNATCAFGTHLTPTQLRQLSSPPGRHVFLAYDQDENRAGQRASQALARQLQLLGAVAFLATLPNGEDPNSYFVHGASAADFIRCLDGAQSL